MLGLIEAWKYLNQDVKRSVNLPYFQSLFRLPSAENIAKMYLSSLCWYAEMEAVATKQVTIYDDKVIRVT